MKLLLSAFLMALVGSFGCGNKSELGGPGASGTTSTGRISGYGPGGTTTTHREATTNTHRDITGTDTRRDAVGSNANRDIVGNPKNNTFDLKAPSAATNVKQGDSKEVTLTVERSKDFKEDVTLKAMTNDKGITVTPSTTTVKASDAKTDVKFTVSTTKEAAIGEHTINVTATPTSGAPTSISFKMDVRGS